MESIFRPDPLPEDMWYQEPLSPEHAEYMKRKAQQSQSVTVKGGAPLQVQKTVTPETSKSQGLVVLPKNPASDGKEETSKSPRPVPHPDNTMKSGKETVKTHPASPKLEDKAKIGKETAKSHSNQKARVPSDKANATQLQWSAEAMAYNKEEYTSSCMQHDEQSIAEPQIADTFLSTGEDGFQNTPRVEQSGSDELTRCCFQRIDYDQGASMHVWNEFLSQWATTNHTEEPWYITIPADKDYLFFGEDGIDMEPLLGMCPRGAHLHSEYVDGDVEGPRTLRIGVYLKVPTSEPMITKPAQGRVTCGHEASMVSMFFALVDWSIKVKMGVECQFSTLLKAHHVALAHEFARAMEKVVATANESANDALDSQTRDEEAGRSRQEADSTAEIQAAKEHQAKKLQDETAHIEKSTRAILKSHQYDEVKCRQALKILIAETDEFIQDDAQRWTIIMTYIRRDWHDKADWASELMCKQGYGK